MTQPRTARVQRTFDSKQKSQIVESLISIFFRQSNQRLPRIGPERLPDLSPAPLEFVVGQRGREVFGRELDRKIDPRAATGEVRRVGNRVRLVAHVDAAP